jgi:hypothetical protein
VTHPGGAPLSSAHSVLLSRRGCPGRPLRPSTHPLLQSCRLFRDIVRCSSMPSPVFNASLRMTRKPRSNIYETSEIGDARSPQVSTLRSALDEGGSLVRARNVSQPSRLALGLSGPFPTLCSGSWMPQPQKEVHPFARRTKLYGTFWPTKRRKLSTVEKAATSAAS